MCLARQLADMGYREVTLNAGCPSGTVVPKHKGAGMLSDLDALDAFFAEVFSHCSLSVSVKTRLGVTGTEEFPAILEIYNKYPLAELIIHARDRAGMYRSTPDAAAFVKAFSSSHNPVCYNGNLFTPFDLTALLSLTPGLQAAMVGRGAAANPALFRQLQGGPALNAEELREFLLRLESAFLEAGLSDHFILARLKELWYYLIYMFPGSRHGSKSINKAQTLADYHEALRALFAEGSFSPDGAFSG